MNEPVGKCARLVTLLQSFDFDITYQPGKLHTNADCVSRRTCDNDEKQSDNRDEYQLSSVFINQ